MAGGGALPNADPGPPRAQIVVSDVRIQDFRGLQDLCVTLDSSTVFIGANNTGKTSLFEALGVVFGSSRPLPDDLFISENGSRANSFVIDVRIRPSNGDQFDDAMRSRFKGAVQLADATDDSEYVVVRTIGTLDVTSGGIAIDRRFVGGWAPGREGANALALVPERPGVQHLELVAFFMLDAKRDLVEELRQRRSHWGRLLSALEVEPEDKEEIEAQLDELGRRIIDSSPILDGVRGELQHVTQALTGSVSDVRLAPLPARIEELARGVDVLLQGHGGSALPMRLHGQGARSLAAVMVFNSFVQRRVGRSLAIRPLVLAAFEEPEAHLHPQAHRAMFHLIADLDNAQKVISTHSPYVLRVVRDVHSIRVMRRPPTGVLACKCVPRKTAVGASTFSTPELAQVRRFVLHNNGEVFFARLVVVVEGDTEELALPIFARQHWGKDHSALGVSFANTRGSGAGKHVARMLDSLEIPWLLFADGDAAGKQGVTAIEGVLGRQLAVDQELFQLRDGACFEQHLVLEGYRPVIEATLAEEHGASALQEYKETLHGQKLNRTELRDYESAGWEDRLVVDYCRSRKGTLGETIADGIIRNASSFGQPALPNVVSALFQRADQLLT